MNRNEAVSEARAALARMGMFKDREITDQMALATVAVLGLCIRANEKNTNEERIDVVREFIQT